MDGNAFDALARTVAARRTRRKLLARFGIGGAAGAAAVASAAVLPVGVREAVAADVVCTLDFNGAVRLGPNERTKIGPGGEPGEVTGRLQITIRDDGSIRTGDLSLSDGTGFSVVGQATGRSLGLRMDSDNGWLLTVYGVAERNLRDCKGQIAGMLIGPESGDLGDWRATLTRETTGGTTGGTTGTEAGACPVGQTRCSGKCVDLQTDPNNCGACGNACGAGEPCADGICHCQYGPGTCLQGYVWRQATPDDFVCVTGEQRDQAANDNAQAGDRVNPDCAWGADSCLPGYVWREAVPDDHVCVTGDVRDQVAYDNSQAASRVDPNGAYGPNSCVQGFVWRQATPDDFVCVTGEQRDQAAYDNSQAANRVNPDCAWGADSCLPGYVWREAVPDDHVCVTGDVRDQVAYDNSVAGDRVDPLCV
jgi:hypothetical protein